jgi:hypothetical protein
LLRKNGEEAPKKKNEKRKKIGRPLNIDARFSHGWILLVEINARQNLRSFDVNVPLSPASLCSRGMTIVGFQTLESQSVFNTEFSVVCSETSYSPWQRADP